MAAGTMLGLAKRKLNITWEDDDTDARLSEIIEDGIVELADKIGISDGFDFSQPGQERKLLLAYCLYGWNNALDDFERNYASDILQARERWEVDRYGSEGEGQGL